MIVIIIMMIIIIVIRIGVVYDKKYTQRTGK